MKIYLLYGFLLLLFVVVYSIMQTSNQDADYINGNCEVVREDYLSAFQRAQKSIRYANEQISDAQAYAWESYDEMGEALENLEEVFLPDDPQTICAESFRDYPL